MAKLATRKPLALPFHALSLVAMLGCDWLIYTGNMLTHLEAVTAWVVTGSVTAGILTLFAEREVRRASWLASSARGAVAALLVAAPLPLLGTALAAGALLWAMVGLLVRRPDEAARGATA
jgi:hypothetical protein